MVSAQIFMIVIPLYTTEDNHNYPCNSNRNGSSNHRCKWTLRLQDVGGVQVPGAFIYSKITVFYYRPQTKFGAR